MTCCRTVPFYLLSVRVILGTPSDTEQNCQIHLACPKAGSVHGNVNMQRIEVADLSLSETNEMLLRGR